MRDACLLQRGVAQAEVARRLEVSRETVSRWDETLKRKGFEALCSPGRTGRKPLLDATRRKGDRLLESQAIMGKLGVCRT